MLQTYNVLVSRPRGPGWAVILSHCFPKKKSGDLGLHKDSSLAISLFMKTSIFIQIYVTTYFSYYVC